MKEKPRIYADFNKLDARRGSRRGVILTCQGTAHDLDAHGLTLQEGMEVILYMPDDVDEYGAPDNLEVDAVVEFDKVLGYWVGSFQWDELDYRSEKRKR